METINKMEKTTYGLKKIFENNVTNKELTSTICKQLLQLNIKMKTKIQPNKNMGRRPKQTFLQRKPTDGQQTHEKMLNTIREM